MEASCEPSWRRRWRPPLTHPGGFGLGLLPSARLPSQPGGKWNPPCPSREATAKWDGTNVGKACAEAMAKIQSAQGHVQEMMIAKRLAVGAKRQVRL